MVSIESAEALPKLLADLRMGLVGMPAGNTRRNHLQAGHRAEAAGDCIAHAGGEPGIVGRTLVLEGQHDDPRRAHGGRALEEPLPGEETHGQDQQAGYHPPQCLGPVGWVPGRLGGRALEKRLGRILLQAAGDDLLEPAG